MTRHPTSVPERPNLGAVVPDAVSDALRAVRFTGAVYYTVDTSRPWPPIQVPAGTALAPAFPSGTGNVCSYHVVVEGSCWSGLDSGEAVRLVRGDVVVYPRGDPYFLADDLGPRPPAETEQLLGLLGAVASGAAPPSIRFGDETGPRTRFVCGFLGCEPRAFDPLLGALPPMFTVAAGDGRLAHLVDLALTEGDGSPGTRSVRERLSESMFLETVRHHLAGLDADGPGWVGALDDELVGAALVLLHSRAAEPWTLTALAREVGCSRSTLAERFRRLVGEPPMQHLGRWRMQLAAHLLRDGSAKVAAVAADVGYESEAAFSRAFKRTFGVAPATWREERG
jgi:AraC-like DNA-binding protein